MYCLRTIVAEFYNVYEFIWHGATHDQSESEGADSVGRCGIRSQGARKKVMLDLSSRTGGEIKGGTV